MITRKGDKWELQALLSTDEKEATTSVEQVLLDLMDVYEQTSLGDRLIAAHKAFSAKTET